jgi:hypothetical protein
MGIVVALLVFMGMGAFLFLDSMVLGGICLGAALLGVVIQLACGADTPDP